MIYRMLGILFLLIGFALLAWSVILVVSGHDLDRLWYALVGLFFMFGGIWAMGVDLLEWLFAILHRRAWRGVQLSAEAEILQCDTRRRADSEGNVRYTYWVTFRFPTTEGPVTLKGRVYKPQYDRLKAAATVTMRYALENPRLALLEGEC